MKAGEIITKDQSETIDTSGVQEVEIRNPINCNTLYGLCAKCYGSDLGTTDQVKIGEAVGIVAAQSIGELGTQLTLRTFHAGGVAGEDITTGLPRVDELFEARSPKWKAVVAKTEGTVEKIEKTPGGTLIHLYKKGESGRKGKTAEYPVIGTRKLLVKEGDRVEAGDPLCEGNLDPKELLKYKGKETAHQYIVREVQKIYVSNGSTVHDKHMDIIVKQMFSRTKINDPGDSQFVTGEIMDKSKLREFNKEFYGTKSETAKGDEIILGITRSALSADGWLAPASFQETARVLIKASSEGREDHLRGLKENVIIGRLVPVGTAIRGDVGAEDADEALAEEEAAAKGEAPK